MAATFLWEIFHRVREEAALPVGAISFEAWHLAYVSCYVFVIPGWALGIYKQSTLTNSLSGWSSATDFKVGGSGLEQGHEHLSQAVSRLEGGLPGRYLTHPEDPMTVVSIGRIHSCVGSSGLHL